MKKILLMILVIMLLIPVVIVAAETAAGDQAVIEMVQPESTTDSGTSVTPPGRQIRSPWGLRDPFGGDPFSMMKQLHDDMDRMFEDSFGSTDPFGRMNPSLAGHPSLWSNMSSDFRVNMREDNGNLIVACELAGMDKDKLKVRIHDNRLLISGERSQDTKTQGDNYYRREIHAGSMSRVLPLPVTVDEASAKASYKDGVLTVTVKKVGKLPEPGREITIE